MSSSSESGKRGMSTGGKVGIGCLTIIVLMLLLGGCLAVFAVNSGDTTTPDAPRAGSDGGAKVVTLAEYEQVKEGMSRTEVESIFQARVLTNSSSDLGAGFGRIDTITYAGEGVGDSVMVQYNAQNLVTSKSQFGLG